MITFEDFCIALNPCEVCDGTAVYMNPEFDDNDDEIPGAETPVACPGCDFGAALGLNLDVAQAAFDALEATGKDLEMIVFCAPVKRGKLRLVK